MDLNKVLITKDADFNGEIKAKSISVEDGVYLKSAIELEREPQIKEVPNQKNNQDNNFSQLDLSTW